LCYSGYIPIDPVRVANGVERYGIISGKGGDAMEIALRGSQKSKSKKRKC
jgi:hypothetical protein